MKLSGKIAGLLCAGICLLTGAFSTEAAVNKAAKVTATFPKNVSEEKIHNNGSFHVTFEFKGKTTINKNTVLGADVYIPSQALAKKGSLVMVEPALEVTGNKWHTIGGKYIFQIRNKNGKIVVSIMQDNGKEKKAPASVATCKKSGKYYKLSIKKCPLASTYLLWKNEVSVTKKVKKETSSINQVYFVRCNRKLTKKYFYWDNLTITTSKTKTITFDKEDYGEVFGYDYTADKGLNTKIAKIQ